uniref:Ovule protein n=1 Tax=Syphacia muris TaxID=451379 RepID=A0A0N5ADA0_9BILA
MSHWTLPRTLEAIESASRRSHKNPFGSLFNSLTHRHRRVKLNSGKGKENMVSFLDSWTLDIFSNLSSYLYKSFSFHFYTTNDFTVLIFLKRCFSDVIFPSKPCCIGEYAQSFSFH